MANKTLLKIINLLNDGQFHDGTSIGAQLNITRSAVWKMLKKLESYGIALESVKGKGYLLKTPLILLDEKKIKSHLSYKKIQFEILPTLKSTNTYLRDSVGQNKNIRVCMAETQTHGKGRLNRKWYAPFGQNIYFSMSYPFQKDISELSGLSLVVALATCSAIATAVPACENKLLIKWPNDIVIDKNKIAGVLIEIQAESHGFCDVIIGIGINVNMSCANKKDINQPWSSLLNATGNHYDRNYLSATLINTLMGHLDRFATNGLGAFLKEWQAKDILLNQTVSLMSSNSIYKGVCIGINEQGHLLLKHSDNQIRVYSSGDTTLY